jgi:hypothetical protein
MAEWKYGMSADGRVVDTIPVDGVYPADGNGSRNGRTVSVTRNGLLFVPGHWTAEFGIVASAGLRARVELTVDGVRVRFEDNGLPLPWKKVWCASYRGWRTCRLSVYREVGHWCRVGRMFRCRSWRDGDWLCVGFPPVEEMRPAEAPPEVAISPAEALEKGVGV